MPLNSNDYCPAFLITITTVTYKSTSFNCRCTLHSLLEPVSFNPVGEQVRASGIQPSQLPQRPGPRQVGLRRGLQGAHRARVSAQLPTGLRRAVCQGHWLGKKGTW